MKRLIFIICSMLIVYSSYGVTVCAKNRTYVGAVRSGVDGTSSQYDASAHVWKVVYDYKTITGSAACNDVSGTFATAQTNLYSSSQDTGRYCWCKMEPITAYGTTTGMVSYWTYLDDYNDSTTCAASCTAACTNAMETNSNFRRGMFESIW